MTKLSDVQLILLTSAASRADGSLLPLPATLEGQSARIARTVSALLKRGLIAEVDVGAPEKTWREVEGRTIGLTITAAGRTAVGIEEVPNGVSTETVAPIAGPDAQPPTKVDTILTLLHRAGGATLTELTSATGWLPHTTRAALTRLRQKGHAITRGKRGDVTCYALAA